MYIKKQEVAAHRAALFLSNLTSLLIFGKSQLAYLKLSEYKH